MQPDRNVVQTDNFLDFGPAERHIGPAALQFGPAGRQFGPSALQFGPSERQLGPSALHFGPDMRHFYLFEPVFYRLDHFLACFRSASSLNRKKKEY